MAERHDKDKERHGETDKDKERRGHDTATEKAHTVPVPPIRTVRDPLQDQEQAIAALLTWMEAESYKHTGSIDASCCRKLIQLARGQADAAEVSTP